MARLPGRADGQAFRSDVRDTCASNRHFLLAQKAQKITEYRDTAPLNLKKVEIEHIMGEMQGNGYPKKFIQKAVRDQLKKALVTPQH